jgi:hypothetical protein
MLFAIVICWVVSPGDCAWKTLKRVYNRAEVHSKEMHKLRFDRHSAGPIRAWFILRRNVKGVFASKLPLYRVDDNPVRHSEDYENRKVKKDKSIGWEIDDGKGKPSAALLEFMNGTSVVFQYYMPDGEIKETTFPLEGAREAIGELLK